MGKVFFIILYLCINSTCYAAEVSAGFGLVASESGDARLRPGMMASVNYESYFLHLYDERETFHVVNKSSDTVILGKSICPPTLPLNLSCSLGVGAYLDVTSVSYDQEGLKSQNKRDVSLMPGISTGLSTSYQIKPLRWGLSWESLFIPAGLRGLIFLANGRKQLFTLFVGMDL